MSKKEILRTSKRRRYPSAEMKGTYTGDEFPEYKGAETITFNNKTYINGLDYQTVTEELIYTLITKKGGNR